MKIERDLQTLQTGGLPMTSQYQLTSIDKDNIRQLCKQTYTIGEVARLYSVPASIIEQVLMERSEAEDERISIIEQGKSADQKSKSFINIIQQKYVRDNVVVAENIAKHKNHIIGEVIHKFSQDKNYADSKEYNQNDKVAAFLANHETALFKNIQGAMKIATISEEDISGRDSMVIISPTSPIRKSTNKMSRKLFSLDKPSDNE